MVAKLLVAAGESFIQADTQGANEDILRRLARVYHRIRDGLGFRRSAQEFGGIPIDAYSHTPAEKGAQQPGMTGQVKEELITRRMELGVIFDEGSIQFNPRILANEEWLTAPSVWSLPSEDLNTTVIELSKNSLAFQCWGIPIIYHRVDGPARIHLTRNGEVRTIEGNHIDQTTSKQIWSHSSPFNRIDVEVPKERVSLA